MLKIKIIIGTTLAILVFSIALPVLAVSHRGAEWTYGGHHDPNNWVTISNYYHRSKNHWSYVGSTTRNRQQTAFTVAARTSYAFINTALGENVVFDAG
ncbi:lactococcin 972 family bacteriocin [Streptococcus phocae subsp. phocae]|uniref:Bacteriocin, lactococcin family protein n=1 Tax=Streptococcus phocae TaxID=119224 RepID=A0A0P6S9B1_9STRE|nr:lactococcin 972 family bacteriocin [Streptococcus phocae]KPJ23204.1 bacteriocin, lactococcin family protein [Streptococcus phocae]